jgi:hypothetical protein
VGHLRKNSWEWQLFPSRHRLLLTYVAVSPFPGPVYREWLTRKLWKNYEMSHESLCVCDCPWPPKINLQGEKICN